MRLRTERLPVLDAIRGFALFGILLLHIIMFQYPTPEEIAKLSNFDKVLTDFVQIFTSSSYRPLFSFMFGVGFVILFRSLERRGLRVELTFLRRFLFLFGLGLIHYLYLWQGDILATYGASGFLLLLFLKCQPKILLVSSLLIWLSAPIISLLLRPLDIVDKPLFHIMDLANLISPELWDPFESLFHTLWAAATEVLPYFLLGVYAMRSNWFHRLEDNKTRNGLLSLIFLIIGWPIKAILYLSNSHEVWADLLIIGNGLTMLGYLFGIMYLFTTSFGERFFKPFQAIGKMSLSNYLSHTIIFTLLFIPAGILLEGIGLIHSVGVFWGLVIACVTIVLQAKFSSWWLTRFAYGPIEWLWRMFTYWKWTPIKKSTVAEKPSANTNTTISHIQ
ncbi:DUF418 domain-containing protein [Paenibacillus sp. SC116]|uniref:DUF418 domain-containing protein n=1 Tax=Paenibacillus sp. SC116 TaxID=2968986 RepID=UPI00215AF7B8|nr:DUF418 domain-containing protein [Paenibacillus sp. SC116]MCR8842133.1 DUF418 domain-containing protein [Paenibacillus sp. SC116]